MQILIVEDDSTVAAELRAAFQAQSWEVEWCATGDAGLAAAAARSYSVIVLDRMLPGMDGFAILHKLREFGVTTPLLILSALGEADARAEGIDRGADDYLAKPFTMVEVIARVRALARRARNDPHPEVLAVGTLELWLKAGRLFHDGKLIELSPKEFELLKLLMQNNGDPVTRRMILERVFNWRAVEDPGTNVVDVHIHRLRQKLEDGTGRDWIKTVRNKGYAFSTPPDG